MNTVATGTKRPAATRNEPTPQSDVAKTLFAELAVFLDKAADNEGVSVRSGYATRLLCVAYDLASEAAEECWLGRTMAGGGPQPWSDHKAYDIAALVSAALHVPGDETTPERAEFIVSARNVLVELTEGDEAVLNRIEPRATVPPTAVYGWDSMGEKCSNDDAVIVNPEASAESLVNWSLGQYRQLSRLQHVIASSGENEMVVDPSKLMEMLNHFGTQAQAVLEVAMEKISEQAKGQRK